MTAAEQNRIIEEALDEVLGLLGNDLQLGPQRHP